jgi:hypothetical protein
MSILNNDYTGIFETYLGIALFIAVLYLVTCIFLMSDFGEQKVTYHNPPPPAPNNLPPHEPRSESVPDYVPAHRDLGVDIFNPHEDFGPFRNKK